MSHSQLLDSEESRCPLCAHCNQIESNHNVVCGDCGFVFDTCRKFETPVQNHDDNYVHFPRSSKKQSVYQNLCIILHRHTQIAPGMNAIYSALDQTKAARRLIYQFINSEHENLIEVLQAELSNFSAKYPGFFINSSRAALFVAYGIAAHTNQNVKQIYYNFGKLHFPTRKLKSIQKIAGYFKSIEKNIAIQKANIYLRNFVSDDKKLTNIAVKYPKIRGVTQFVQVWKDEYGNFPESKRPLTYYGYYHLYRRQLEAGVPVAKLTRNSIKLAK